MEISSGPNITPMKPNRDSPMTTPNIVMRGWVSAIFLENKADEVIDIGYY